MKAKILIATFLVSVTILTATISVCTGIDIPPPENENRPPRPTPPHGPIIIPGQALDGLLTAGSHAPDIVPPP